MAGKLAQFVKKIALALFYILIYFAFHYFLAWQAELLEEDIKNYSEVITILASIASVGVYLVILYVREIKPRRYLKFKRLTLIDGVLTFVLAFGFRILTGAYLMWSEQNVPLIQRSIENAPYSYSFNTMTTLGIVSVIVSVCIVGPLFEEILFRGMVLGEIRDIMPGAAAVLFQGLLFGLAHAVLAQSLFAAVYGVLLGAIYLRTRNLSVVALAHIFFNASSVLEVKSADMINQMFVSGFLMTVSAMLIFFYIYKRRVPAGAGEITGGNSNV